MTELIVVHPRVKVNCQYYYDVLLYQHASSKQATRLYCLSTRQRSNTSRPQHNIQRETPDFIGPDFWPPNSADLNPVDYKIWVVLQH